MASLSVDEKDWLQEQIRTVCESSTNVTTEKHEVTSGMLRNNVILQNLIVTVQK